MAAKQMILLLQRVPGRAEVVKEADLNLTILAHPKARVPMVFIDLAGDIFELQSVLPKKHGSWFVNQKVSSNPSFYMASKIDPLFLCLPYFETRTQFSPLDQIIISSDETSTCARIPLNNSANWKLENIADVKDLGDDLILYRYSELKTIAWLTNKVKRAARHLMSLRKARTTVQNTAFVGSFNMSAQSRASAGDSSSAMVVGDEAQKIEEPESEDIRGALQVVTEYLTDNMSGQLITSFGLTMSDIAASKSQTQKRKADWELELEIEKEAANYALPVPVNAITSTNKNPATAAGGGGGGSKPTTSSSSAGSAAAAKKKATESTKAKPVQKGVKSITSFFGAKK